MITRKNLVLSFDHWNKVIGLAIALLGPPAAAATLFHLYVMAPMTDRVNRLEQYHEADTQARTELLERMAAVESTLRAVNACTARIERRLLSVSEKERR